MFGDLFHLFYAAYLVCQGLVLTVGVIAAIIIFCRAKGTWRERIRNNFGGGT